VYVVGERERWGTQPRWQADIALRDWTDLPCPVSVYVVGEGKGDQWGWVGIMSALSLPLLNPQPVGHLDRHRRG